jgi:hypothetical protein
MPVCSIDGPLRRELVRNRTENALPEEACVKKTSHRIPFLAAIEQLAFLPTVV